MSRSQALRRPLESCAWALAFAAALAIRAAGAASLDVAPVRLVFEPDATVAAMRVNNIDATAATIQARIFLWEQTESGDLLTPTNDFIINPPIATIEPGSTQILRVGLRKPVPAGARERSYRLLIDSLPRQTKAGAAPKLNISLRLSIPVFLPPRDNSKPDLTWRFGKSSDRTAVIVTNDGNRHVQLHEISVGPAEATSVVFDGSVYLLAGATRRVPLSRRMTAPDSGSVRIRAETDAGPYRAEIQADDNKPGTP